MRNLDAVAPVLVTAADSFVGYRLVTDFAASGIPVVGTFRGGVSGLPRNVVDDELVTYLQVDLADPSGLGTLARSWRGVVHLASRQRDDAVGTLTFKRDHVDSAVNLFSALSGFKQGHLVVASTVSVHGSVPGGVLSARTPCGSSHPYGATKLKVEELAQRMWQGRSSSCVRLPAVVGAGAVNNLLARLLELARRGDLVEIQSASSKFNNLVHVQDATNFVRRLLEGSQVGHHAFPIASAEPIEMRSVVRAVTQLTQSASNVVEVDETVVEPFYICDREAREKLGYTSLTTMEAITRFIDESVPPGVELG